MGQEPSELAQAELLRRIADVNARMKPFEEQLAQLRAERDLLQTELRRRDREAKRTGRAGLRELMRAGKLPTLEELVAAGEGELADYAFHLKTGGEVRLGYPGARQQTLALTDGQQVVQASDLARAAELYAAGWELGSPGRPGVRVHLPGTRQERLVPAGEVYAGVAGAAQRDQEQ